MTKEVDDGSVQEIDEMLSRILGRGEAETPPAPLPEAEAHDLRVKFRQLSAPRDFEEGDLVTQILGLQRYTHPSPGRPAVVTRILPAFAEDFSRGGGVAYDRFDMVVLASLPTGFNEFVVDSRVFERWVEP